MRARWLLVIVAVVLVAVACGVPLDETPRAMESTRSNQSPDATIASAGDTAAYAYMVLDGSLVPAAREVPARTPRSVLDSVVQQPSPDEAAAGFVTAVPNGTTVLDATQTGDLLNVNLSKNFENIIGPSRQEAIGQFVFTATELPGITDLTFSIEGRPLQVSSPTRGDVDRVMDCDFLPLLPTDDKIAKAGIGTEAARRVISRRRALEERCADAAPNGSGANGSKTGG